MCLAGKAGLCNLGQLGHPCYTACPWSELLHLILCWPSCQCEALEQMSGYLVFLGCFEQLQIGHLTMLSGCQCQQAAVTKKNIICWILHTHSSQTTVSLTRSALPVDFEGLRQCCQLFNFSSNSIACVFTMAGHKEIPFAIQSQVITSRWWQIFAKFLKFVYSASLGKSCIHVHVSTVT